MITTSSRALRLVVAAALLAAAVPPASAQALSLAGASRAPVPMARAVPQLPAALSAAASPVAALAALSAPAALAPAPAPAVSPSAALAAALPAARADVAALAAPLAAAAAPAVSLKSGGDAAFARLSGERTIAAAGDAVVAAPLARTRSGLLAAAALPAAAAAPAIAAHAASAAPVALAIPWGQLFWPIVGTIGVMVAISGVTVFAGIKAYGWWQQFKEFTPDDMTPLRYFPKHVAMTWRVWRDPVRRAQAAQAKRTKQTLDVVSRKSAGAPARIDNALTAIEPLLGYVSHQYAVARASGPLLESSIQAVARLKKHFYELFSVLPASEQELDVAEWFADEKGTIDVDSKDQTIALHFPSLLYKSVNDMLKARYTIERVTAYNEGMRVPPTLDTLEVGNDQKEEMVVNGSFFVKDAKGRKFVVGFNNRHHKVVVTGPRASREDLDGFLKELEGWIERNHIYRGKSLGYAGGKFYFLNNVKKGLTWDDYIIDPETRTEIEFYTTKWLDKLEGIQEFKGPSTSELKSGLFLYGGKGIGKTLLSHVLMSELSGRSTFINITASTINKTEDVQALFAGARELGRAKVPVIMNFAEFDTLGAVARDSKENRFLGQILEEMDGVHPNNGMLMIGTSNLPPSKMDGALFRPGRFDFRLQIPSPDDAIRARMLTLYFQGLPLAEGVDVASFSGRETEGFIPADFKQLAQLSLRVAWIDSGKAAPVITGEHIVKAAEMIRMTKTRTDIVESSTVR